jgi:hypothetical protein
MVRYDFLANNLPSAGIAPTSSVEDFSHATEAQGLTYRLGGIILPRSYPPDIRGNKCQPLRH